MERSAYQQLAEIEDTHWWFVYRRKLIAHLLERSGGVAGELALDIGCGTGGNLPFLKKYCANVCGIDLSEYAIALARRKYPGDTFLQGDINELRSLYPPETFDLISDFSVLCHEWVKSDLQSMRDVHHLLRPGGIFVVTETALPALRRAHDHIAQIARRYTLPQLNSLLEQAGFRSIRGTYFNAPALPIAFVLAFAHRLRLSSRNEEEGVSELKLPPNWLNDLLAAVLRGELAGIRTFGRIPLGVSIACVARKL
jgi:SAM-dependent methyltransferase